MRICELRTLLCLARAPRAAAQGRWELHVIAVFVLRSSVWIAAFLLFSVRKIRLILTRVFLQCRALSWEPHQPPGLPWGSSAGPPEPPLALPADPTSGATSCFSLAPCPPLAALCERAALSLGARWRWLPVPRNTAARPCRCRGGAGAPAPRLRNQNRLVQRFARLLRLGCCVLSSVRGKHLKPKRDAATQCKGCLVVVGFLVVGLFGFVCVCVVWFAPLFFFFNKKHLSYLVITFFNPCIRRK